MSMGRFPNIFDKESRNALQDVLKKKVISIVIDDNVVLLTFQHGIKIKIWDEPECCEERYITTDDDLKYFFKSEFLDIELAPVSEEEDESGIHEFAFLYIRTSKGVLTLETHNKHNGYYGGFNIKVKRIG